MKVTNFENHSAAAPVAQRAAERSTADTVRVAFAALAPLDRWVPFARIPSTRRPGKSDKIPSNGTVRLSTARPADWCGLDEAMGLSMVHPDLNGVGLVMTGGIEQDDLLLIGFDFDGLDPKRSIKVILDEIEALAGYVEYSPSGNGLRAFALVKKEWAAPYKDSMKAHPGFCDHAELYFGTSARFLTVTFNVQRLAPIKTLTESAWEKIKTWGLTLKETERETTPVLDTGSPLEWSSFQLTEKQKKLLSSQPGLNRSEVLHGLIISLAEQGASAEDILATIATNEALWAYCLDHRHDDPERALTFAKDEVQRSLANTKAARMARLSHFNEAWKPAMQDASAQTEDQVEPLDLWQERPPRKFTADLMPPVLGDWAMMQARVSGLDPAGFAFAALAAAAGAIPGGLRVRPDAGNPSWHQSALLWVALVGETGTGKTPCIEVAVRPLVEVNRRLMEKYKWALAVQEDATRGQPKGAPKTKLRQPRALAHDVTIEKLGDILEANPQGILITRDELTAWLNGMGQYKGHSSGERGDWLSLWNGNSYAVDRITRGSLSIPFWGASILGGIQPARISPAVQDGLEDGMLPRFLIALLHPDNQLPRESVREITTLDRFYAMKLQALRGIPAADVSLTNEAAALFDASCLDMRDIAKHLQYLPALQVFLHKWPNLLARVALVFHAIGEPRVALSGATMQQALAFMHFALNHQQRFYERMSSAAPAVALGREVALVLLAKKLFPLRRRDLQRYCRHWLDADDGLRREAIHWLQDCGWLTADISQREQRRGYAFGDGTAWEVNPLVAERFADLGTRESARRAEAFQRLQRRASDLTR